MGVLVVATGGRSRLLRLIRGGSHAQALAFARGDEKQSLGLWAGQLPDPKANMVLSWSWIGWLAACISACFTRLAGLAMDISQRSKRAGWLLAPPVVG